ncbi:GerMN domain-containing protein [Paenibacillus bouchesdurhonensis]|uniref:GerMN domain-containing protein n=1 Tax=Paenibacillus bouchesdurhonensis TaxID=1870990 RepID=UPI000DA60CFB|nr:GerMN domain-containing protein [Paenibacillus bouchesdurhonensis]
MKWNRSIRNSAVAGLLALPLLLTACNPFAAKSSGQIDPPPEDIEYQMLRNLEPQDQTSLGTEGNMSTVYLENDHGLLAPVALQLPEEDNSNQLTRALESLVKDGPYAKLIPSGFTGVLPEGTEVKAITLQKEQQTAIVEFTEPFRNYEAGDERKVMEALTWTLTENPDIRQVQLWVDGEKLNEMPVDGTPLERPLTRALGINLELNSGISLSQSSPVTVYFSAATPEGVQYFVPVTRFVASASDRVKSALEELIKGPTRGEGMERVVTDNTTVDSVDVSQEGIVTVSISDDMFDPGERVPAQMLQSLVLTVTENTQEDQVRIWLNGEKDVVGLDNQKYSEPVSRPVNINEIPL